MINALDAYCVVCLAAAAPELLSLRLCSCLTPTSGLKPATLDGELPFGSTVTGFTGPLYESLSLSICAPATEKVETVPNLLLERTALDGEKDGEPLSIFLLGVLGCSSWTP